MISEDELRYYKQLDERQQRLFLGMKAKSLGRSGSRIVSEAFGVNIKRSEPVKRSFPSCLKNRPSGYVKLEVELKKTDIASGMD